MQKIIEAEQPNLVTLSNSILAHFGAKTFHDSDPVIDEVLKGHKKVAVMLFDGLGEYIFNNYPRTSRYFIKHKVETSHSVNPATTVACTTSFLTGQYPIETGWMGWSLFFNDLNCPVDVFTNRESLSGNYLGEGSAMFAKCPHKTLDDLIKDAGGRADLVFSEPIRGNSNPHSGYSTLGEMVDYGSEFFSKGDGFLYMYWPNPDSTLHDYGVNNWHVRREIRRIKKAVSSFCKKNPDVLVLTIADHGLVDVTYRDIAAFPDIYSHVSRPLSLEPRSTSFCVKEGEEKAFEEAFSRHLGGDFALFSRKQILDMGYFGEGEKNEYADSFLGDYVALATGSYCLFNSLDGKEHRHFQNAHHAGATKEEKEILIAAFNR